MYCGVYGFAITKPLLFQKTTLLTGGHVINPSAVLHSDVTTIVSKVSFFSIQAWNFQIHILCTVKSYDMQVFILSKVEIQTSTK